MSEAPPKKTDAEKTILLIDLLLTKPLRWRMIPGTGYGVSLAGGLVCIDLEKGVMGIKDKIHFNCRDQNNSWFAGMYDVQEGREEYAALLKLFEHARKCSGDNSGMLDDMLATIMD